MPRRAPVPSHEQSASKRYRLLYKIATGGSGTVYVGQRLGALGFSRLVAIKRANPDLAGDAEARQTLVREARIASRIHHAHVVAVHDVEVTGDEVLLVMEYVPGTTLADLLEAGKLPPRLAARIALDACSGLRAVHELCDDDGVPLGALHRDISPENVLIGLDGSVRITDFGLAKLAHTSYATATTLASGKLAYAAPEILDGGGFGVRSDLFALGVVVWEALSGTRLFSGRDEAETSRRVRTLAAPPISSVVPEMPPELDGVLARALDKSARARWESVGAFLGAFEAVVSRAGLMATESEVGTHVRAVAGEDRRSALARGRVTAASGRPAVDFTFAETASMVHGGEPLDDEPTALRPLPAETSRNEPVEAAPAPASLLAASLLAASRRAEVSRPHTDVAAMAAAPATAEVTRAPVLAPSNAPSSASSWRRAGLVAGLVALAGGVAALGSGARSPGAVADADRRAAGQPAPSFASASIVAPPASTAEPSPEPEADERAEPAPTASAPPAARSAAPRPAKEHAPDPTSLPANPYRKKL